LASLDGEFLDLSRSESDELFRTIEVSGYKFKDGGLITPSLNEDGSIFITGEAQAELLRECVIHNAKLSQSLIDAHSQAIKRSEQYHLPRNKRPPTSSIGELRRIDDSKALYLERIELAKVIGIQITKLFNLQEHEYLQADE
jgi:hypothetical protein